MRFDVANNVSIVTLGVEPGCHRSDRTGVAHELVTNGSRAFGYGVRERETARASVLTPEGGTHEVRHGHRVAGR